MGRPARIVSIALDLETEGTAPDEAFALAVAQVSASPGSVSLARAIWRAQSARAGRVEVVLPNRATDGRFVAGGC